MGDAVQMADRVLRHAFVPAVHPGEYRVRLEPQNNVELFQYRGDHAGIVELMHQFFVVAAAHEDADEHVIVGAAVGPLDGAVGRGVYSPSLDPGDDEAESLQGDLDVLPAEGDRDSGRGGPFEPIQLVCERCVEPLDHPGGVVGCGRDDDVIGGYGLAAFEDHGITFA